MKKCDRIKGLAFLSLKFSKDGMRLTLALAMNVDRGLNTSIRSVPGIKPDRDLTMKINVSIFIAYSSH